MEDIDIFTSALELASLWYVKRVHFEQEGGVKKLHIELDYPKGSRFDDEGEVSTISLGDGST